MKIIVKTNKQTNRKKLFRLRLKDLYNDFIYFLLQSLKLHPEKCFFESTKHFSGCIYVYLMIFETISFFIRLLNKCQGFFSIWLVNVNTYVILG